MNWNLTCAVLLHPTSLPGPYGIGDLGPAAIRFLDFLTGSGQNLWQMLPLNPPGAFQSPYQCYSAFAGNPLLIAPDRLVAESLIPKQALSRLPSFSAIKVDFARVYRMKLGL